MRRTSPPDVDAETPVLRLTCPQDLIRAVPYLLGFHPRDSLVLVGTAAGDEITAGDGEGAKARVQVVARIDLADIGAEGPVENAARALSRAQSTSTVALVWTQTLDDALQATAVIAPVEGACAAAGLTVACWVFVGDSQWATGGHDGDDFVIAGPFEHDPSSTIPAAATYAGLVAQPDRQALAGLVAPEPIERRELLLPALERASRARAECSKAVRNRCRRSDVRSLFTATRTLALIDGAQAVRFGVALADIDVRDACWLAVEGGRIDGEALWRELSRSLPDEYRAPPLFLFGWQQWRSGRGALAAIAVEEALRCDSSYHAAELLDGALKHGLDPFRTPRLRKGA